MSEAWAGGPYACDSDDDGDGATDGADNCPWVANPGQLNTDSDGAGDVCDSDDDGDGATDGLDNCPLEVNPDQLDSDSDGAGDVCDSDDDGDGVADGADNCPLDVNPSRADADSDGVGDACDCTGDEALGLCWHLGAFGQSCNQVCAPLGGFDPRTAEHVGIASQGGSVADCAVLMGLQGLAVPQSGVRPGVDNGLGCHVWDDGVTWWLMDDPFHPDNSNPRGAVFCGCER